MVYRTQKSHVWLKRVGLWVALSILLSTCHARQASIPAVAQKPSFAPSTLRTTEPNQLGMNIDFPGDYSGTRMFADAMKQSRNWQKIGLDAPPRQDAQGWPQEDARITVWHGIGRMQGLYRLSFQGQAAVNISCCSGQLQNQVYDPASNTTTADLVFPSREGVGLFLEFKDTRRSPTAARNTGITEVKLMRPQTEGGRDPYPATTLFTTPFKAALRRFQVLRFMDFTATNSNGQEVWSDRLTPDWYSMFQAAAGYGWQGRGGAYEYAIQLCNELETDCWLNVPAKADDDYVRQLAILIQQTLNPERKLYLEYSNEVWNVAPAFQQSSHNLTLAKAEVATGRSPLNFDGTDNESFWAWRRVAQRGAEISLIFRQVFGDAAMMTRVRPLLMTQLGYTDGPLWQALYLMQDYYNHPQRVADPRPPNYYFYGLGGSAYYDPKNPISPDALYADLNSRTEWVQKLQQDTDYAAAFGLKRIAYEGGPSLEGGNITDQTRPTYRNDPRIIPGMVQSHDLWSNNGGDLLAYFTLTGESPWGFVPDIWDAANPTQNLKLQAIDKIASQNRAQVTYGVPLPATLAAQNYQAPPSWVENRQPDRIQPGHWFSYTTRVDQAGTFSIQLQAEAQTPEGQVEVWVDGVQQGTLSVPQGRLLGSTGETEPLTLSLASGLHGLLIRGAKGMVNLKQIQVRQIN